MAILDHTEVARQQRMNDAYSELLNFLDTKKGQKYLNKDALETYLKERHQEIEELNKKIEEYQNFFNTLSNFLPRSSSTSRILF